AAGVVSALPAGLYVLGGAADLWAVHDAGRSLLVALGGALLPMAMLSVAMHQSTLGLDPRVLLPAIIRTLPAYLTLLGFLVLATWLMGMVFVLVPDLAIIGGGLAMLVVLYFVMVLMYGIGLIYRVYRSGLGWVVE
ncbi:MAG: hypothetical protein ACOC93_05090, partial [Planctomycetota bacterium]